MLPRVLVDLAPRGENLVTLKALLLIRTKFDVIVERIKLHKMFGAHTALIEPLAISQAVMTSDMCPVCVPAAEN